jgi:hypothetical protein
MIINYLLYHPDLNVTVFPNHFLLSQKTVDLSPRRRLTVSIHKHEKTSRWSVNWMLWAYGSEIVEGKSKVVPVPN